MHKTILVVLVAASCLVAQGGARAVNNDILPSQNEMDILNHAAAVGLAGVRALRQAPVDPAATQAPLIIPTDPDTLFQFLLGLQSALSILTGISIDG